MYKVVFALIVSAVLEVQNVVSQDNRPAGATVTLHGHIKFRTIPLAGGVWHLEQYCDPGMDRILRGDRMVFQRVSIGKARNMKMIYEIRNDTIQSIRIDILTPGNVKALVRMAERQFGPSVQPEEDRIRRWIYLNKEKKLEILLDQHDSRKGGMLSIRV